PGGGPGPGSPGPARPPPGPAGRRRSAKPRRAGPTGSGRQAADLPGRAARGAPRSGDLLAAQRARPVEGLHRRRKSRAEGQLERVGDLLPDLVEDRGLALTEFAQDVLDAVSVRSADADAEADELVSLERAHQGKHAVVARRGAAAADPEAAERQVELVVDDPDRLRLQLQVPDRCCDRLAAEVHVGLRPGQPDPALGGQLGEPDQALPAPAGQIDAEPRGEHRQALAAEVVAGSGGLRPWIAPAPAQEA